MTYTVDAAGWFDVTAQYFGRAGRPELPLFGLRFETPEPLESVHWLGLSGETYPDRKKGGRFGWHCEVPQLPAYLVPQECGCHTDTRAVSLHRRDGATLTLEATGKPFAFSALPYTPQQLEAAAHREELPQPVRTVVTVCGAMRGVGGIDSWGADVEPAYHANALPRTAIPLSMPSSYHPPISFCKRGQPLRLSLFDCGWGLTPRVFDKLAKFTLTFSKKCI